MSMLKKNVLAALIAIKEGGPKDSTMGICANVGELVGGDFELEEAIDNLLNPLFQSWPDKSINAAYPVGNWTMQPSKLFWRHFDDKRSMWDINTRYGAARMALLDHCITELTKGLNK